jgi:signal transduction histidine kinase
MQSQKADAAEEVASSLHRKILELGIIRDEYLLYGEERARQQWETNAAQLDGLLRRAAGASVAPLDPTVATDLRSPLERSQKIFHELVEMNHDRLPILARQTSSETLRARLTTSLLVLSYDLYNRAARLSQAASRRSDATSRRTLLLTAGMIVAVLGITIANALATSRLLEERITRLRDGARRIADGDFGYRMSISGTDELAELGHAFDEMTVRLQSTMAQLSASNRELEAFNYSVAHDLRAPLRIIYRLARTLAGDHLAGLDEQGRECVAEIRQGARRMEDRIDALLSFARLSKIELNPELIDLTALARSILAELSSIHPGPSPRLVVADAITARFDPRLARVVLENLLGNAWKFTSGVADGCIEFGSTANDGVRTLFVRDNGAGFDMAHANKLFAPFQRLHTSAEFPGTGIGLATVQRIVQRHGGRVWAEGAVGKGATVYVSLPDRV